MPRQLDGMVDRSSVFDGGLQAGAFIELDDGAGGQFDAPALVVADPADLIAQAVMQFAQTRFVVVVGAWTQKPVEDLDRLILERLKSGDRPADIARELARRSGTSRSDVYARVLEFKARDS